MSKSALVVDGVSKSFGSIKALEDINLSVKFGEIVALLGDNGAGKSTLMNIICGSSSPDVGTVRVEGQVLRSLADAKRLGVGVVYQDLALAPHLNVSENMHLGAELSWRFGPLRILNRQKMDLETQSAIEELGISTLRNVRLLVDTLSGGQRQVLAVARSIMHANKVILLDEPTAALGPKQVGIVLDAIRQAARSGLGVLIVSHDIPNVLSLADRIIVLKRGGVALDRNPGGMTVSDVMTAMVGQG